MQSVLFYPVWAAPTTAASHTFLRSGHCVMQTHTAVFCEKLNVFSWVPGEGRALSPCPCQGSVSVAERAIAQILTSKFRLDSTLTASAERFAVSIFI